MTWRYRLIARVARWLRVTPLFDRAESGRAAV